MNKLLLCSALLAVWSAVGIPTIDKPRVLTANTTVTLEKDLELVGTGTHFVAGKSFGVQHPTKLIITSETGKALIIRKNSTWDLSSFDRKNRIIEFTGNARLVIEKGAQLRGNGGVLRFSGDARLIVGEES